jgi:hypothetical protein
MRKYSTLENRIREVVRESRRKIFETRKDVEKDQSDQIVAGTYKTKHFEMGPLAQKLFATLPKGSNPDTVERMAIAHDQLFALMKQAHSKERTTADDTKEASTIADKIRSMADSLGLSDRIGYLNSHVDLIKKYEQPDTNIVDKYTDVERKRFISPPTSTTTEPADKDVDNSKFIISRNIKAQRKLKIIDAD